MEQPRNYVDQVTDALAGILNDCDDLLLRLYALLALTKGTSTTLKDVHDAWALWRTTTNAQHRSLIPFEQLAAEVQQLDAKYRDAIHTVATQLGLDSAPSAVTVTQTAGTVTGTMVGYQAGRI